MCQFELDGGDYEITWSTEYSDSKHDSDLDVFFMTEFNYDDYNDGESFLYKSPPSVEAIKTYKHNSKINLDSGSYVVVLDFTDVGTSVSYGDEATVKFSFEIEET